MSKICVVFLNVYIFLSLYILHVIYFNLKGTYSRYEILNPIVEDMLYIAWEFSGCFAGGGWVCIFLPSHTLLHIMSGALYSGMWSSEIEELCSKTGQMYVLTQVCENSS